ncbi:synaptogenesis protein syg-2-like [Palaemon carinicauda]|uniref:synaptogenesis protein syg-2-like n=1 Tax=Palaemon carinicauda TaxID=392227 RepID=UPI0035B58C73
MSVIEASLSVTAERELQGGSLTCYARAPTHPNASEEATILPRSASVSLNITLSPVEVRILEPEAVVATSGSTITIVCHALGSHPPADLSWWRGTRSLEPHVTHAIQDGGNITTATLTIVVTGEDNGATLTCRGSNPALPQEPLSDRRKLIVYYEPIVDLTLGRPLESENIKEEDDVYFECGIRSNPRFHHILWYHNGQEIFQDISGGVVISKQSLVIRNVSRSHSGSYSCVATNAQGRTHSNTFLLKVQHSPICAGTGSQERTKGAARGTEVKAKCQVEAEPSSNLIWSWVRKRTDGSEEILSPEKYTVEGLTSTLTVIPQRREDYGRLLCRATNNIGRQREPCSVNVVPAGPPDTPTNCSATPIISDDILPSLSVTCLEGFDGGLPQIFLLEVWQNGKVLANISSDFPEWVVSGMEAGKVVRLSIVGHNIRGQSDPVIMKVQTTSAQHRAASEKETDVEVTPIMDAALGVVGVILLLLLVGVVIVRKTYNCQRKSVTEKTLASSSGEGLDPDVVQSIKRLDVVPCVQEEHTKEESDPMFTYSEHRHLPINGGVPDETHQITVESIGDEDLVSCQISAVLFNSPRQRRSCDIDTQSLNLSQEQSEDSGVSESESDNEIKLLEEEKKLSFIPSPQGKSHPSYIALQLNTAIKSEDQVLSDRDSGSTHPSTFTDVSESGRTVSKKSHKWSPVGFSLRQIPFDVSSRNMIQRSLPGKIKRGPPYQEETTTPVEAIGLDSTPIGVLSPFTNESLIHAKEKNMCLLPQSESVSQSSEHPKKDPARILGISKSDIGVPVTLYKADNGELLLMPKKPSDYGDIGVQLSTAPIYTISTLPKATGKKSKSSLETRPKEKDYLHIEKDDRKLPKKFFNDKYTYTKHAEPRIYVPPIHPDVCRRESSV